MTQLRPRDLAKAIAEVRDSHLREIWPNGSMPTIYTYGSLADATWSAWGSIDGRLRDALERPLPDYEPVSRLVVRPISCVARHSERTLRRWAKVPSTLATPPFAQLFDRDFSASTAERRILSSSRSWGSVVAE